MNVPIWLVTAVVILPWPFIVAAALWTYGLSRKRNEANEVLLEIARSSSKEALDTASGAAQFTRVLTDKIAAGFAEQSKTNERLCNAILSSVSYASSASKVIRRSPSKEMRESEERYGRQGEERAETDSRPESNSNSNSDSDSGPEPDEETNSFFLAQKQEKKQQQQQQQDEEPSSIGHGLPLGKSDFLL